MQKLAIGKILQGLRKAKGITQEQLSEILGVSCAAISKWENEQMYPDISFFPI
ncbi:MAG: helix-turn-helix transcriptional regulator, partial [Eubacterium sp.]|nr:helix-turn-helix transcriptional regulator [Eubacterium sp.]